tara:strand:- start:5152 stop:5400 length:249 start_codon:yes stop_codon:yes gene_type:complete
MTKPLPKWIQTRYAILWKKFKDKEFTFEQAEKVLNNNSGINVFFSDLRKAGWLEVKLSDDDTRKRVYKLKSPTSAIEELSKN